MQLTSYTDYALRVMIYLAELSGKQATITEIAEYFDISRNHLVKVVQQLGGKGFIKTTRGKGGGLTLQRPADMIIVGDVVRSMEKRFYWVECFNPEHQHCRLLPRCRLKHLLDRAGQAYLQVLDNATLADLVVQKTALSQVPESSPEKME